MSGEGTKTATAASGEHTSANLNPVKIAKGTSQKKENPPVAAPDKKGSDRATDKDRKKDVPHSQMQFDDKSRVEKAKKRSVVKQTEAKNRVELFRHLPQYKHGTRLPELESKFFQLDPVHPAVFKVEVMSAYTLPSTDPTLCDFTGYVVVVVVVVDAHPKLEGRLLLRRLVGKGVMCTYTHINAISYIMHEVSRVLLGASSVLSNETVYSRVGTASVVMVAHSFHVRDPETIAKVPGRMEINHLDGWANSDNLQLLNLIYDATPSDYVSMIITDYGMIPATSVPVIVREYRREYLWT
ncbi:hypothetical protein K7X08_019395 [Anisodus acutangulus]|uniref:Translation initiation factor eIF2B subunit delta n=1 Tax=Anisodus acutangulus TaxID=402998 RepID=A0A9Q1MRK8_9SOLA|nr:hypothetical protein K7X08_019395 [Anisodus acutangulus]